MSARSGDSPAIGRLSGGRFEGVDKVARLVLEEAATEDVVNVPESECDDRLAVLAGVYDIAGRSLSVS